MPWVVAFLRERGLALSAAKTRIVRIEHGFDFLGWNFRKYTNRKLFIKPSKKNAQAFYRNVSDIVEWFAIGSNRAVSYRKLNPVLRGWAEYHKGAVAKATFSRS